jgi:hypothetical protein
MVAYDPIGGLMARRFPAAVVSREVEENLEQSGRT